MLISLEQEDYILVPCVFILNQEKDNFEIMLVFKEVAPLKEFLSLKQKEECSIGFIPTMGALHQGHLSLIEKSLLENQITVCSIFVNPLQFNNIHDLEKYPKTQEEDILLLESVGCTILFSPSIEEMYPQKATISFNFGYQETILEGLFRPGHFSGVGIVVAKLFNIVQPHKAYFGQKDFQQCIIVKQLIQDLSFNIKLEIGETLRESDGLAMSSRNVNLNPDARKLAPKLYETLQSFAKFILSKTMEESKEQSLLFLSGFPLIQPEYIEVLNFETGLIIKELRNDTKVIICIAALVGNVRLIDNLIINL